MLISRLTRTIRPGGNAVEIDLTEILKKLAEVMKEVKEEDLVVKEEREEEKK